MGTGWGGRDVKTVLTGVTGRGGQARGGVSAESLLEIKEKADGRVGGGGLRLVLGFWGREWD